MLITLSGIDGTGKSTIAAGIQQHLRESEGISSRYVWCKFGKHPLSGLQLGRHIGRGTLPARRSRPGSSSKPNVVRRLYLWFMLVAHLAEIRQAVRRQLRLGQTVICDRYIFDTMIDLAQEMNLPLDRSRRLLEAAWIPRPDCSFVLDLPAAVAFRRKPDSESIEFLEERRRLYLELAATFSLVVVDSARRLETVLPCVIEHIQADIRQKEAGEA